MTTPEVGAYDAEDDDDAWRAHVTSAREWEANEADLIEQAIAVPDDDSEFDR
jgi:hypothetical protein